MTRSVASGNGGGGLDGEVDRQGVAEQLAEGAVTGHASDPLAAYGPMDPPLSLADRCRACKIAAEGRPPALILRPQWAYKSESQRSATRVADR